MNGIGLQLYSVREATEKDFLGTLRKVIDLGYEAVQFAGFFDIPAKQVKQVLDERNICVAGSHTSFDLLAGDKLKEIIQYNQEIDNDLIICPYITEEKRDSVDSYRRTAEELNYIGQIFKENGMRFAYHNHHFELENYGGTTGFDLLFCNTEPEFVKIELDGYWATYAGFNPTAIMDKYAGRIVSLHMKDMKVVNGKKQSIEIGEGTLDMNSLLTAARNHQVDWLVVEQEDFDRDPMESAKISLDNLRKLLD